MVNKNSFLSLQWLKKFFLMQNSKKKNLDLQMQFGGVYPYIADALYMNAVCNKAW